MRVETRELIEQSYRIRYCGVRMDHLRDEVLDVVRDLRSDVFREWFETSLRCVVSSMDDCGDDMVRLAAALTQIARIYERNERTLEDEAEASLDQSAPRGVCVRVIPAVLPLLVGSDDL